MKITRREFIPAFAAFGASFASIASANEVNPKNIEPVKLKEPPNDPLKDQDSTAIETLRWIDPNLSELIVTITYCFTESIVFHKINYKKLKKGIGGITEADLIHNNSERWSNAMATAISCLLTYAGRFPFTAHIANSSSGSSEEVRTENQVFSDFMTINAYYGHIFADRYLTNAFQHELREAYKKVLNENPQYEYSPWAIPLKKTIQTLRDIAPTVKNEIVQDFKTSINNLGNITDKKVAFQWAKSRRNQLNLLLVPLSYISTFVDYIPLATANKVPIYTANTATGRAVADLPRQHILWKDLLKKLKDKGDIEGYNEEKVIASAGLYNGPIYYVINSSIQSVVDSAFNLKELSSKEVAYSNLREIIGAVNGSIIFMFMQYKLESSIRSNTKDSNKVLKEESIFTRFANWYIEPYPGEKPNDTKDIEKKN